MLHATVIAIFIVIILSFLNDSRNKKIQQEDDFYESFLGAKNHSKNGTHGTKGVQKISAVANQVPQRLPIYQQS